MKGKTNRKLTAEQYIKIPVIQKISFIYFDIVALYYFKHSRAQCIANPATACKQNVLRLIYCKVFSPFFSLKQNKVNRKNWAGTNFEVPEKQKDVWDVFFKIKKKDDGD